MKVLPLRSGMTVVPLALMVVGMIIMFIAASTLILPLSIVGFGVGPFSVSVGGIPALSATVLAVGAIIFASGVWALVMMTRR
jgi:hypothetical protein